MPVAETVPTIVPGETKQMCLPGQTTRSARVCTGLEVMKLIIAA